KRAAEDLPPKFASETDKSVADRDADAGVRPAEAARDLTGARPHVDGVEEIIGAVAEIRLEIVQPVRKRNGTADIGDGDVFAGTRRIGNLGIVIATIPAVARAFVCDSGFLCRFTLLFSE